MADQEAPPASRTFRFIANEKDVRRGHDFVCTASTRSWAKRIAQALNYHQPAYDKEKGYKPIPRQRFTLDDTKGNK
jgi:hypothetical protein